MGKRKKKRKGKSQDQSTVLGLKVAEKELKKQVEAISEKLNQQKEGRKHQTESKRKY